jgi:hypothetical protein
MQAVELHYIVGKYSGISSKDYNNCEPARLLASTYVVHVYEQAYMMAKLIEELRREQQHMVDYFANGVM